MDNYPTIVENGLNPNIIDEVSATETYLGFAKNGDETTCAIVKILKTETETRFLCPGGYFEQRFDWSHRADGTYNYLLKKI